MTRPASNLRVRRTQKLLREALIELIEERGFRGAHHRRVDLARDGESGRVLSHLSG